MTSHDRDPSVDKFIAWNTHKGWLDLHRFDDQHAPIDFWAYRADKAHDDLYLVEVKGCSGRAAKLNTRKWAKIAAVCGNNPAIIPIFVAVSLDHPWLAVVNLRQARAVRVVVQGQRGPNSPEPLLEYDVTGADGNVRTFTTPPTS